VVPTDASRCYRRTLVSRQATHPAATRSTPYPAVRQSVPPVTGRLERTGRYAATHGTVVVGADGWLWSAVTGVGRQAVPTGMAVLEDTRQTSTTVVVGTSSGGVPSV